MNEDLKEFISRSTKLMKEKVRERVEKRRYYNEKWRKENKDKFKESLRKYSQSEKGKLARKRVVENRKERLAKACEGMTYYEWQRIKMFYENCPNGMCVDHIIPLAKGGKHHRDNLQYLKKDENAKKSILITELEKEMVREINFEKKTGIKHLDSEIKRFRKIDPNLYQFESDTNLL